MTRRRTIGSIILSLAAACMPVREPLYDDPSPDERFGPITDEHVWSRGFGSSGYDRARGVAVDSRGDVYFAGHTEHDIGLGGGVLAAGPGFQSGFLAKYDGADGAHFWSLVFRGDGSAEIADVAVDATGAAITVGTTLGSVDFGMGAVSTNYGIFVVKTSPDGDPLWVRIFDSTWAAMGEHIATHGDRIYVTAAMDGTLTAGGLELVSAGDHDGLVLALDLDGEVVWARRYGGAGVETALGIDARDDGVVVTGEAPSGFTIDGITVAGGAYVLRLDAAGAVRWVNTVTGFQTLGEDVLFHADGSVTMNGKTTDMTSFRDDSFLAHFSSDGHLEWWRVAELRTGGVATLAADGADRIVLAGHAYEPGDAAWSGAFLETHDADGAPRVLRAYPSGQPRIWDVEAAGDSLIVAGSYGTTLDLGGGPLPGYVDENVFVARLRLPGVGETDPSE